MKATVISLAVSIALTGLVGYHGIYQPHQQALATIARQMQEEQATQKLQAEVAGLLDRAEAQRKHLAPEPESSWLVREVLTISREVGIELTSIQPEEVQTQGVATRLAVTAQLTATYHQLGQLLDRLERSQQLLFVEQFTVQRIAGSAESAASVTLVIASWYMPRVAVPGS